MKQPFYSTPERRAALTTAAYRWLDTPFRHNSRVPGPGGGVNCVALAYSLQVEAGASPEFEYPTLPLSWHEHHEESGILEFFNTPAIRERLRMIDRDDPTMHGDLATVLVGQTTHHLGTVFELENGERRLLHVPRGGVVQFWPLDHKHLRIVGIWRVLEQ